MSSKKNRGEWGSSMGFILAAAGSAIGLGNIWKFPYLMGRNGGVWFLLAYLVFIVIMGMPVMLGEMALGRAANKNPVGAFAAQNRWATPIGAMGVLAAFIILSYYSVIGGWVMRYLVDYTFQGVAPDFGEFTASAGSPILWHGVFLLWAVVICLGGVSAGIERASRLMMPTLFLLLLLIVIRAVTLPGAGEGLRFMFDPRASQFSLKSISAALGQVFFSLSLGMGIMITYGSYLGRNARLVRKAVIVPSLDTFCALLAGLAILPTVFAFGKDPTAGPSLVFVTLPDVFSAMPAGGRLIAILFFIVLAFAAVTSAVSLLECVISYTIDELHWSRLLSLVLVGGTVFLLGIPSALSSGLIAEWKPIMFGGRNFLDAACFLTDNILMPIGGLLMCIFVGWVQGPSKMGAEIANHGAWPFRQYPAWAFIMRYIAPVLLIVVMLVQFGVFE